jgi:hypothetical protein
VEQDACEKGEGGQRDRRGRRHPADRDCEAGADFEGAGGIAQKFRSRQALFRDAGGDAARVHELHDA